MFVPLFFWLLGWHKAFALLAIACIATGSLIMAGREWSLKASQLEPFIDKKMTIGVIASIRTDPKLGQPKKFPGYVKPASTTVIISDISYSFKGRSYAAHVPLRLTTPLHINYLPGTVISAKGILYSTPEKRVVALFVARGPIVIIHGPGATGRVAGLIREKFRKVAIRAGGASSALIPGIVLGDTSLESYNFIETMVLSGLTHLTAVSGENFAIIAAFTMWFLQWLIPSLRLRLFTTACVLLGFIILVRPSPSVLRATVMVAVLLLSRAQGAKSTALPALGLAIGLLILIDPFEAIDPGFALSVAATAGILFFSRPISLWLTDRLHRKRLADLLAIPISANILCTPIAIAISGQLSLMSIPSNFLVEPVVVPITVIGFIAALLSPVFPDISYLLVLTQKPLAGEIVWVSRICSQVPVLHLRKGFVGAVIGVLATIVVWIAIRWQAWRSH
jgi:competence protein ComEC